MEWALFINYLWASLAILIAIEPPDRWWKAPIVLLWPLIIPLWLIEQASKLWERAHDD